jgi:hypothetical protein
MSYIDGFVTAVSTVEAKARAMPPTLPLDLTCVTSGVWRCPVQ